MLGWRRYLAMRVAWISANVPWPVVDGNAVAMLWRLKALSAWGHEVAVYAPCFEPVAPEAIDRLSAYCQLRAYPVGLLSLAANLLCRPSLPLRTLRRFSLQLQRDLREQVEADLVDLLVVEHSAMAPLVEPNWGEHCKMVVVFQSLVFKALARDRANLRALDWKRPMYGLEARTTERLERRLLLRGVFDEYWFNSQADMRDALRIAPALAGRVHFIPIGVDERAPTSAQVRPRLAQIDPDAKLILLVGSMDNPSNEDSVRWFAEEILPAVRAEVPNALFLIVGRNSSRKLRDLRRPGVTIAGQVIDLTPYLHACDVFVIPQRGGAGVRTKLIDALSAQRVVVSTPVGIEALNELAAGVHYVLARDAKEFQRAVVSVLKAPERFAPIAAAGFEFFQRNFSESAVNSVLLTYLRRVMRHGAPKQREQGLCATSPVGFPT